MAILSQYPATGGVKGSNQRRILAAKKVPNTLRHLFCGLVGEGDRQNVPGAYSMFMDKVRYTVGNNPRLSGTCAGEDKEWAFGMQDGLLLRWVEM